MAVTAKPDVVDILMRNIGTSAISATSNDPLSGNQTSNLQLLNVVLEGPPGCGKTSLKRLLLGKSPNPSLESLSFTDPDEVISIKLFQKTNGKLWNEINDDDIIELLAAEAANYLKNQAIPDDVVSFSADVIATDDSESFALEVYDEIKSLIKRKLDHYCLDSITDFSSTWYRLIDCGGLPQFNDMLPHLYNGPAFQIVCLRLTDNLEDRPEIYYFVDDQKVTPPEALRLTNLQYIERACQTAASYDPPSKVLIVGTHKDKLKDPVSRLHELNQQLSDTYKKYEDVLVIDCILDMNVVAEDEDERKLSIKRLQNNLDFAAESLAKPIPFQWLIFHLSLLTMGGVVNLKHWLTIGKARLGLDADAVVKALTLFKESDLLLFFPEVPDLSDLVLTNVDSIVERLSKFLMNTLVKTPDPYEAAIKEYNKLKQKGTFTEAFFKEILPDTIAASTSWSESFFDNEKLLKILTCLNLAVQLENDDLEYFLPSALSYCSNTAPVDSLQYLSCGFTLGGPDDKKCILPRSFFLTTVVMLLASKDFKFQLRKSYQQHRDHIHIYDASHNIPGVVMLTDKTSWIQVSIKKDSSRHCPVVHKAVKEAINAAKKYLKHSEVFDIEEVFPCPVDENHHGHYCLLTKDRKEYTCSDDPSNLGHVTNDMTVWTRGQLEDADGTDMESHVQDKIVNAFKAADNQFQGIAFVISGDAVGAAEDEPTMSTLFRKELNFAEYHISSASKTEIVNLISAAEKFEYPIFCEYIVFYYSGHGGIEDGKPFLLPNHNSLDEKVFVENDILKPFQLRDEIPFKGAVITRKYLFLFDCCLLSSATAAESKSLVAGTEHFKNTDSNSIIAYATAIGSKAQGENRVGGRWTKHLSHCLAKDKSFDEALSETGNAMMKEPSQEAVNQEPFMVGKRSLAKKIFLARKPSSIWTGCNQFVPLTEARSPGDPSVKGASGLSKIERAEWNKRFKRAQVQKQIESQIGESFSNFTAVNDGNYGECDVKVEIGYFKSLTLHMKNTYVYDFEYKDTSKKYVNKGKKSKNNRKSRKSGRKNY